MPTDLVVIGGGQAGLSTAAAARQRGLSVVLLEAGAEAAGAWPHYYDSLRLFSPARWSGVAGHTFPGDPDAYPTRDEVVAHLRDVSSRLDVDVRTGQRVTSVRPVRADLAGSPGFVVHTDRGEVTSRLVVSATGSFTRPHRPTLPGLATFTGQVLHAAEYRSAASVAGERVVVVGGGNSGVQIATELAASRRVTVATRRPLRLRPQRVLGRDVHWWVTRTIDLLPAWLVPGQPGNPVLDSGMYRAAVAAGRPDHRRLFTRLEGPDVVWSDGSREPVGTVLLATGYAPETAHLADLPGALSVAARPRHRAGLSPVPGLGYVGLEWQSGFASATLRGVGRDARHVVAALARRYLR